MNGHLTQTAIKLSTFLVVFLISFKGFSQDVIYLSNPSFEDIPGNSSPPREWLDCGKFNFPGETPPDVQPSGSFMVFKDANHGNTYLGMVVRDNNSWEAVSQPLSGILQKGKTYEFSIDLCTSEIYRSATARQPNVQVDFVIPAKLRIFGGTTFCDSRSILLAESAPISNNHWKRYSFTFTPVRSVNYITLEVFYAQTPVGNPYNGNILLDNASSIKEIVKKEPPKTEVATKPPVKPQTSISSINGQTLKPGQIIRIDEIFFKADTSTLDRKSYTILDELYRFLLKNNNVKIEVGGHTNGIPSSAYCDKLSTDRAKEVASYLIKKGIPKTRVSYKGYGKRQPIASDKTSDGRKKNQRVEIKILST